MDLPSCYYLCHLTHRHVRGDDVEGTRCLDPPSLYLGLRRCYLLRLHVRGMRCSQQRLACYSCWLHTAPAADGTWHLEILNRCLVHASGVCCHHERTRHLNLLRLCLPLHARRMELLSHCPLRLLRQLHACLLSLHACGDHYRGALCHQLRARGLELLSRCLLRMHAHWACLLQLRARHAVHTCGMDIPG